MDEAADVARTPAPGNGDEQLSERMRQGLGVALVALGMVPLLVSLDLLADRRVITALVGLLAGGLLAAAGARLLLGGGRSAERGEERRAR